MPAHRVALLPAALVLTLTVGLSQLHAASDPPPPQHPPYGQSFWDHWGDGNAELAGYRLTFPRYGETRHGTAVTIFVTETFSNHARVKADPGRHRPDDTFPVIKLNLIYDFPTGVYDYNLMTSAFVALEAVNGRPPGAPTKVAFSSQEWCGLLHSQYLFNPAGVDYTLHSYFDGEADQAHTLPAPPAGLAEDALLLWARRLAGPTLEPGQTTRHPILKGLQVARLQHESPDWSQAALSRSATTENITVPAGTFAADCYTAQINGGRTWTIYVDRDPPNRIIKWSVSDGQQAELTGVKRMKYWQMNGSQYRRHVRDLGLDVRDPGSM